MEEATATSPEVSQPPPCVDSPPGVQSPTSSPRGLTVIPKYARARRALTTHTGSQVWTELCQQDSLQWEPLLTPLLALGCPCLHL